MNPCKWNGRGNPRILTGRHAAECPQEATGADLTGDECPGCLPCPERHCVVCQRVHADGACPECIAATRDDLAAIRLMCGALPTEVEHRGVNGEAMMLLGPSADPEAWRNRAMSAMRGRIDAGYLDDCRDEQHPLWVLGTWEQLYREEFDHASDLTQTIERAGDYLERVMHRAAESEEVPFDDFARDVRGCRGHLEDILRDGERNENGAPCVQCERPMTRVTKDRDVTRAARREGTAGEGAQDAYECQPCRRTVTGDQYRYAVGVAYRAHADRLTAAELVDKFADFDVKASQIRVWGSRGIVRKRGRNDLGVMLYDVEDVERRVLTSEAS